MAFLIQTFHCQDPAFELWQEVNILNSNIEKKKICKFTLGLWQILIKERISSF